MKTEKLYKALIIFTAFVAALFLGSFLLQKWENRPQYRLVKKIERRVAWGSGDTTKLGCEGTEKYCYCDYVDYKHNDNDYSMYVCYIENLELIK